MKFLMNENVPLATIRILKKAGWDLISISDVMPSVSDESVMELAIAENRTIITFDRDYGTLIYKYGYRPPAGVIYLRIQDFAPEEPAQLLIELIKDKSLAFKGLFTVVDDNNIRQRKY